MAKIYLKYFKNTEYVVLLSNSLLLCKFESNEVTPPRHHVFLRFTSRNVVGRVTTFDKMSEIQPYQFEPIYNPGKTIENERSDEESPPTNTRLLDAAVSWCSYGKCDSEKECLCCAEIATVSQFVLNSDSSYITELEEFKTVYKINIE